MGWFTEQDRPLRIKFIFLALSRLEETPSFSEKNKVIFFLHFNSDGLCELRRHLYTINLLLIFLAATYLSWIVRCCSKGRIKAKSSGDPTSCNSDDLSRRRFKAMRDRLVCRHAERICCVKEMQKLSCQSGKYEAT